MSSNHGKYTTREFDFVFGATLFVLVVLSVVFLIVIFWDSTEEPAEPGCLDSILIDIFAPIFAFGCTIYLLVVFIFSVSSGGLESLIGWFLMGIFVVIVAVLVQAIGVVDRLIYFGYCVLSTTILIGGYYGILSLIDWRTPPTIDEQIAALEQVIIDRDHRATAQVVAATAQIETVTAQADLTQRYVSTENKKTTQLALLQVTLQVPTATLPSSLTPAPTVTHIDLDVAAPDFEATQLEQLLQQATEEARRPKDNPPTIFKWVRDPIWQAIGVFVTCCFGVIATVLTVVSIVLNERSR